MTQRDSDHRPSQYRRLAVGAGASAAALLAAPSAAQAVDFEVTGSGDAGSCTGTSCPSLRAAINAVNASVLDDPNRILFASSLSGSTITLGSPLPPISPLYGGTPSSLEIVGPGAPTLAVSGDDSHRIFEIEDTSGPVTISGLTLRDGFVVDPEAGGAIHNEAELTFRNSIVTGNEAAFGGGIRTSGATMIEGSTISGNSAVVGGGVRAVSGATLTIRRSTISGNRSDNPGNDAGGGGVSSDESTVTIEASTITANEASSFGGGVQARFSIATIEASTITANEAVFGGGVQTDSVPDPTLTSTIVAGNTASGAGPDLAEGEFQSAFSLIGNTSGADINDLGGSILNQPAQLGPLAGNGGPTPTHTPALTSPAIDAGLAAGPDQRGFARPVNQPTIPLAPGSNAADIGAVELAAVIPPIVIPSNDFRFGKLKRKKKKGIAILIVHLPGPGEIGLRGKGLKRIGLSGATARASRFVSGGRVKLRIKAAKKGKAAKKLRKRLRNKGKAKRRVRVTYVPTGGAANTQSRKVKLVKKRAKR